MLDELVDVASRVARETEELNNSVIDIMRAVGEIATTKDLSLRVPVTENVTGAIADALNLLTEETGNVLTNVSLVSQEDARLLRQEVGDTVFFRILRRFHARFAGGNASSADFIATAVAVSGRPAVRPLLRAWLYDQAIPPLAGVAAADAAAGPVAAPRLGIGVRR